MEEQDILSYGIGMTTLEEVFLKCNSAEGDENEAAANSKPAEIPMTSPDRRTSKAPLIQGDQL